MNKLIKIVFPLFSLYLFSCNYLDLESITYSIIELTGQESEIISQEISVYRDSINIGLDNVIGYSNNIYTKTDFNDEEFNSSLGNLIADIIFIQSDSILRIQENKNIDFVIQNYGGIRSYLPEGEIKLTDAYKILPFENEIVIVEMDGKSVNEIVSFLRDEIKPHPISGILINDSEVLIQDKPIVSSNKYYIAINDYLLTGGDNMFFFNQNSKVYRLGYSLRDAFIDYTKSKQYLSSNIDNRFIKNE